jgi:crotonobetainyl-CoA:carnitine CoA-transferase CaiB-like acyl-CoA transferase
VLSVEQALSMPYATMRMSQLGWRVIRVEPTPAGGRSTPGDPNRYIGRALPGAGDDRRSYFVAPNVGKEAIAIDLKKPSGQALLARLVRELGVDVFCTNTMLSRHADLGIGYDALRAVKEDLVWCAISAMGPRLPDVPGYDPVMQALCGYMDLTGPADGPPTQCGPPIIDLKAGDEAFTQVLLALLERAESGLGKRIDVPMAQAAVSWLLTSLPMLEMGSPPSELRRSGNEHRQFIPTNAYATRDGFVYLAIGSDAQWARLLEEPMFAPLAEPAWATNEGRRAGRAELYARFEAITRESATTEVDAALTRASIPHAPITPIERVMELDFVASELLRTRAPDGRTIRLPPPAAVTPGAAERELPFPPSYGQDTTRVLSEVGLAEAEIQELYRARVVA